MLVQSEKPGIGLSWILSMCIFASSGCSQPTSEGGDAWYATRAIPSTTHIMVEQVAKKHFNKLPDDAYKSTDFIGLQPDTNLKAGEIISLHHLKSAVQVSDHAEELFILNQRELAAKKWPGDSGDVPRLTSNDKCYKDLSAGKRSYLKDHNDFALYEYVAALGTISSTGLTEDKYLEARTQYYINNLDDYFQSVLVKKKEKQVITKLIELRAAELTASEKVCGKNAGELIPDFAKLADAYREQGDEKKSAQLFESAMSILKTQRDDNSVDTETLYTGYAKLKRHLKDDEGAAQLEKLHTKHTGALMSKAATMLMLNKRESQLLP